MRLLLVALYDLLALLAALLTFGPRALARRGSSFVGLELRGDPPWRTAGAGTWLRLRMRRRSAWAPESIQEIARALERAAGDPRARGAVIRVEGFTGATAKLEAVRSAALALRESGKPVAFYGRAVGLREYALMACGTRVHLAPGGHLDLKGYSAELWALGGVLASAGIKAHFLRRGEHKTAPELFTDREVSAAQREAVLALLEDLSSEAVRAIAQGRKTAEEEVRARIDAGPYSSARARDAGLADSVGDFEDLQAMLAARGEKKAPIVPVARYRGPLRLLPPGLLRPLRRPKVVAVVPLDGILRLGRSARAPLSLRSAGSDSVAEALGRARDDRAVKAIVLAIDSRGGSSLASELVLRAVRRAAEEKPVVAYIERVAASGGYMAAVGASAIVAAPGAVTGSIGVFAGKFEASALLDRLGAGRAVVQVGRHAAMESALQAWSDEERSVLEREIDEVYQDFLAAVAQGRRRPVAEIEPLAEGRIYSGRRALAAGLVDALGGFEDALGRAASLAGLREPPRVVLMPGPRAPLWVLAALAQDAALPPLLPLPSERLFSALEILWRFEPRL